MKIRKFYSIFTGTGALALTLALTACTNGMMGEGSNANSNSQNNTGFVDQGLSSSIPTELNLTVDQVVGTFRAHDAVAATDGNHPNLINAGQMGVVANLEPIINTTLSATVLADMIARAETDSSIGNIPVSVLMSNTVLGLATGQGRQVKFKFSKLVSAQKLKNVMVVFPNANTKPVFARMKTIPAKSHINQTSDKGLFLLGGLDQAGYEVGNLYRIPVQGTGARPVDAADTYGQNVIPPDSNPILITQRFNGPIINRYKDVYVADGTKGWQSGGITASSDPALYSSLVSNALVAVRLIDPTQPDGANNIKETRIITFNSAIPNGDSVFCTTEGVLENDLFWGCGTTSSPRKNVVNGQVVERSWRTHGSVSAFVPLYNASDIQVLPY